MRFRHPVLLGLLAAVSVVVVALSSLGDAGSAAHRASQTDWAGRTAPLAPATSPSAAPDAGVQAPASTGKSPGAKTGSGGAAELTAPGSVGYLMRQYGISRTEAQRRIALQLASTELEQQLAEQFPDEYAGMWLDQAGGGVLRVGMTRPDRLAAAMGGFAHADRVKTVPMARSLRELTEVAADVSEALGPADDIDVVIDQPTNSVRVLAPGKRADDAALKSALSVAGSASMLVEPELVNPTEETPYELKSCDPRYCAQAPIRGGIRLDIPRDDLSVGGCTTGFRVRSATTGRQYLLTAGHCVLGPRHTRVDDTFHQFLGVKVPVSVEDPNQALLENDYLIGRDYAIMRYQPGAGSFWLAPRRIDNLKGYARLFPPASLINFWCPGGCAGSRDIQLRGHVPLPSVKVGWIVCATGAGYTPASGEKYVDSGAGAGYVPGTRCGEVIGTDSVIRVRICARPGDSGGPLFTEADGKALGILSGGDPGRGACTNAAETNFYAPISTILDRANARTGGSLGLELDTTGPFPR